MSVKRVFSRLVVIALFLLVLLSGFVIYKNVTEKPPFGEMKLAREAIATAKSVHAGKYASERLKEAEKLYNEAMAEWILQNNKFFVFRDFSRVKELAAGSLSISVNAKSEAGSAKDKYKQQLENELSEIEIQIVQFETIYKKLPVGRINFDRYNEGKMKYLEALQEYKNNNFHKALILAARASEKLKQTEKASRARLNDFFGDLPEWQKNGKLAYQLSKKGQTVFLINKLESSFSVLKGGKVIRVFEAEFGPNWMGDKVMKGDRATPQGVYRVAEKKRGVKTIYHKALLLDYPNTADKVRFDKMKKSGAIPKNAHIGGLIEIHGGGGKGIHWTDGCIALKNAEMDVVYNLSTVATPVIIIGSENTLDEYLSGVN